MTTPRITKAISDQVNAAIAAFRVRPVEHTDPSRRAVVVMSWDDDRPRARMVGIQFRAEPVGPVAPVGDYDHAVIVCNVMETK